MSPIRAMAFDKVRIRFRKRGDLRLISHHDLMRGFERVMRRGSIPFRLSEGFHPLPRMVFALSLPLGTEGLNEVVELEMTEPVELNDLLSCLRANAPNGLEFLSAKRVEMKTTARPRRAVYHFEIPPESLPEVRDRCGELLSSTEIWVPRNRPTPKRLNVRPYINDLRCDDTRVVLDIWISQEGSARADELLRELGLQPLLDDGAYPSRTELHLLDEMTPEEVARLPELPNAKTRAAFERPLEDFGTQPEPETASVGSQWGASPNGPVVE